MELTKKIWHDENSEPPKNYLWAKGEKLFKYVEGQWKEVSKKDSEDEGSGSGSGSGASIDELMEAFADFDMWITPEGDAAMGIDEYGTQNGTKTSFGQGYIPTENAVSVPITNYFHVSDLNVLKLLMSFAYGQNVYLGVNNKTDNCVGVSSESRGYGTHVVVDWDKPYPRPTEGISIYVTETGGASTSYPNAYLFVDPNDYTKCLVEPEDLNA